MISKEIVHSLKRPQKMCVFPSRDGGIFFLLLLSLLELNLPIFFVGLIFVKCVHFVRTEES